MEVKAHARPTLSAVGLHRLRSMPYTPQHPPNTEPSTRASLRHLVICDNLNPVITPHADAAAHAKALGRGQKPLVCVCTSRRRAQQHADVAWHPPDFWRCGEGGWRREVRARPVV